MWVVRNFFKFYTYIYKIEIRNSETYLPELSVSSIMDKERQQFKYQLEEHMDMMSGTIKKCEILFPMPRKEIKIKEVAEALGRIKKGEQPGPDRLKGEIYMGLKKSEKLVLYLTQAYNAVPTEGTVPKGWKESKTVMIPKTGKPTAKDHRPIALTNVGY